MGLYFLLVLFLVLHFILAAKRKPENQYNKYVFVFSLAIFLNYSINPDDSKYFNGSWLSDLFDLSFYLSILGLIYLGILYTYLFVQKKSGKSQSETTMKHFPNSDKAIEEIDDDRLNRRKIAADIAEFIKYNEKNNITIGLMGDWGTGKTSTLSLIKKNLEKKNMLIIDFIPWYFGDTSQDIILKFITQLNESIKKANGENVELYKDINNYAKLLSAVSIRTPGLATNLKEFIEVIDKQNNDLFSLKKKIEKELYDFKKQIVVFIDDIDRLDNKEIQIVFKLIRLVCDFPNIIYVLAFDEQMVSRSLGELITQKKEEQLKIGNDYLQKFIQLPIYMPKYERKKFEEIIKDGLEAIFHESELLPYDRNFIIKEIQGLNMSIRNIKRYFNTLSFFWGSLEHEVNPFDLSLLLLLKINTPELYKYIARNKQLFTKETGNYKNELDKFFKDTDYSQYNTILRTLFSSQHFETEIIYPGIEVRRQGKRLADPEYFSKYFIYSVPEGEIINANLRVYSFDCLMMYSFDELMHNILEVKEYYAYSN